MRVDGRGEVRAERTRVGALAISAHAYGRASLTGTHAGGLALVARDRSRVGGVHMLHRGELDLAGGCAVEVTARQGAAVVSNTEAAG